MENISRIIEGCIAKEYTYQRMVYKNYRGFAMKIVFRYIYRHEKVVDLVNDGFVRLFDNFQRFTPAGSDEENRKMLMGYIKKIMVNTSIDALRKGSMLPEIGGIPDYVWAFTNKDDDADQQLLYQQLITLIKELPPPYRIAFNMYEIDGYSHMEIAGILQIPVGTSKSNLSRAKTLLKANIKKYEDFNYAEFGR